MEIALMVVVQPPSLLLLERISNFFHLKRVTAWILHFVSNFHHYLKGNVSRSGPLTVQELVDAEAYSIAVAQQSDYGEEISTLTKGNTLPKGKLLPLHPFLDKHGLLSVGGRAKHLELPFSQCHPIILLYMVIIS